MGHKQRRSFATARDGGSAEELSGTTPAMMYSKQIWGTNNAAPALPCARDVLTSL
ncbi:MAG: hypothetical protein GQ470_05185 [Gammaproteobacteria bacterium]|nr:hypothetical protein [Gammaproteobacteria bacterium]